MELDKGTRVILNQNINGYPAGTSGVIIRVEQHWVSATDYSVLLDEDGGVLQYIKEDQLYAPDVHGPADE